jgi:hypothetical protein
MQKKINKLPVGVRLLTDKINIAGKATGRISVRPSTGACFQSCPLGGPDDV